MSLYFFKPAPPAASPELLLDKVLITAARRELYDEQTKEWRQKKADILQENPGVKDYLETKRFSKGADPALSFLRQNYVKSLPSLEETIRLANIIEELDKKISDEYNQFIEKQGIYSDDQIKQRLAARTASAVKPNTPT